MLRESDFGFYSLEQEDYCLPADVLAWALTVKNGHEADRGLSGCQVLANPHNSQLALEVHPMLRARFP